MSGLLPVSSGFTLVQRVSDSSSFLWLNIAEQVHSPWSSPAETGPGPEHGQGGPSGLAAFTSVGSSSRGVSWAAKMSCSPHPPPNPNGSPGALPGTGGCAAPVVQPPDALSRLHPGNVWAWEAERAPRGRRREEPRSPAQRQVRPPLTSSGFSKAGTPGRSVPSWAAGAGLGLCGAAAGLRPHSWCPQVTRNKSCVGTRAGSCVRLHVLCVCVCGVHVTRVREAWARPRRWRPCFSMAPALPHHRWELWLPH